MMTKHSLVLVCSFLTILPCVMPGTAVVAAEEPEDTTTATLNSTTFEFDNRTGGLLRLSHAGAGDIIRTDAEHASLLELAYPTDTYPPLRLAPRWTERAQIDVAPGRITITWNKLGNSFPELEDPPGAVKATVELRALDDGRSIAMQATIDNQSPLDVPQIMFPDFMGLRPVGGKEHTYLRLTHWKKRPFVDMGRRSPDVDIFITDALLTHVEFWGAHNDPSCGRWFDYGWAKGGLSGYQQAWGYNSPVLRLYMQSSEATPDRFRMLFENRMSGDNDRHWHVGVEAGKTWVSPEFVITPHAGGWPKGIVPYRTWVRSHPHLDPIAKHIHEDIGYRQVWMSEAILNRPGERYYFNFADLPELLRETSEHGMSEMMVMFIVPHFELPYRLYQNLGTPEELEKAVDLAREMAMHFTQFLEAVLLKPEIHDQWGGPINQTNSWSAHIEMVPRYATDYAAWLTAGVPHTWNPVWQQAVLKSMKEDLLEKGYCASIWTDSYKFDTPPEGVTTSYHAFARQIRALARQYDPDASYGSETIDNIEDDCAQLDTTFVWVDVDTYMTPANNAFASPRFALNIEDGPNMARRLFIDNTMMSVMPRRPDGANATGWIKEDPAFSAALKQCAALRKQFLSYFTDGINLGDGFPNDVYEDLYMGAYQHPRGLLVLLLNERGTPLDNVPLGISLAHWLEGEGFSLQVYDADGKHVGPKRAVTAQWNGKLDKIAPSEIRILEFTSLP